MSSLPRYLLALLAMSIGLLGSASANEPGSLHLEDMTWVEVSQALQAGKRTAIIFTGSTEQNGPHLVLGKHNRMAYFMADAIARELGNALVFPIVPFAPNGDVAARGGHLRFPGTLSLRRQTFTALVQDLVLSAISAGFDRVLLMGDHGDGQDVLAQVARELDAATEASHVRVFHIAAMYDSTGGAHAGREDTSMLMAIDQGRWVRHERISGASAADGADADPVGATAAEGRRLIAIRVQAALKAIRALEVDRSAGASGAR